MTHATYNLDGPMEHLRGLGALIREDDWNEDHWMAQFDARWLPEAFGWRSYPKRDFTLD